MDKIDRDVRAEIDRLIAEDSKYAVMLMSLGGMLITDVKLRIVEQT